MSGLRLLFVALLLSCLACATQSAGPADAGGPFAGGGTTTLTIEVLGLTSDEGSVALAIFDSSQSFDEGTGAVASETLVPEDRRAIWRVRDLPAGLYAVAVFHDLNDNGELDRSILGPPSEPYGFSNDARGTFGPPRFDSALVELPPGEHTLRIRVR